MIQVCLTVLSCLLAAGPTNAVPVQVITFGHSRQGRPLHAYLLGTGQRGTAIFGGFHGNEPASPDVVLLLLEELRSHPGEWAGESILLAPEVNPDGLRARTRKNAAGVDLNRNFPGSWQPAARDSRHRPGATPASEPETRAVMALIARYKPTKIVSIHQPLHCMNWTGEPGRRLAEQMRRFNRYRSIGDIGYPTPGSFGHYCGSLGIAMVTLELPRASARVGWEENRSALLAAIHWQP